MRLLGELKSGIQTVRAGLAERGSWQQEFEGAETALLLHEQITSKTAAPCQRKNVDASALVFVPPPSPSDPWCDATFRAVVSLVFEIVGKHIKPGCWREQPIC
jgi:hypothetical protein